MRGRSPIFPRTLTAFVLVILVIALATAAYSASMKGRLYVVTKQTTLSNRAGLACEQGKQGDNIDEFCDQTFLCPEGHVAKGLIADVGIVNGEPVLNGIGIQCREPNEIYQSKEVGPFGESHSGKVYRDACDTGFNLAGLTVSTKDQRNITGVSKVCRRYWPVEERQGPNTYGSGPHKEYIGCEDGNFVTGLKASYVQERHEGEEPKMYLTNFRFFCAEMRHWISEPEDGRDPRDPKTRK